MKKITLALAALLVASVGFGQTQMTENPTSQTTIIPTQNRMNVDMATAIRIEAVPYLDPAIDPQTGTQEEGQAGCNFNVPSLDYKFIVMTGGTLTATLSAPAGVSDPVFYYATDIDETDPTALTVTDNAGGVGAGCFDNDAGLDGMRTALFNPGDIIFMLVANEGVTDLTLDGDAVLEPVLGVDDNALASISIYPNPATDVVNVRIPASVEITGSALYDVLGKRTGVQVSNGTLDISGLARGVYLLNLETSAGTLTEKIIKK